MVLGLMARTILFVTAASLIHVSYATHFQLDKSSKILHITDLHFDYYKYKVGSSATCAVRFTGLTCCRAFKLGVPPYRKAGEWGDVNCDSPLKLILGIFDWLNRTFHEHPEMKPDFAIWTGDNPSHHGFIQSRADDLHATEFISGLFKEFLPGLMVYPCEGNHDAYPRCEGRNRLSVAKACKDTSHGMSKQISLRGMSANIHFNRGASGAVGIYREFGLPMSPKFQLNPLKRQEVESKRRKLIHNSEDYRNKQKALKTAKTIFRKVSAYHQSSSSDKPSSKTDQVKSPGSPVLCESLSVSGSSIRKPKSAPRSVRTFPSIESRISDALTRVNDRAKQTRVQKSSATSPAAQQDPLVSVDITPKSPFTHEIRSDQIISSRVPESPTLSLSHDQDNPKTKYVLSSGSQQHESHVTTSKSPSAQGPVHSSSEKLPDQNINHRLQHSSEIPQDKENIVPSQGTSASSVTNSVEIPTRNTLKIRPWRSTLFGIQSSPSIDPVRVKSLHPEESKGRRKEESWLCGRCYEVVKFNHKWRHHRKHHPKYKKALGRKLCDPEVVKLTREEFDNLSE
eukprot:887845_1